jgi:hypothetical protein
MMLVANGASDEIREKSNTASALQIRPPSLRHVKDRITQTPHPSTVAILP